MLKPPLSVTIASLVLAVNLAPVGFISHASGQGISGTADREEARRKDALGRGIEAEKAGDRAMKDKDYEKAFAQYRLALDLIPNSPNTSRLYVRTLNGFCDAGVALAKQRIAEGRYGDADLILRTVLDERYDPNCKAALVVQKHLEEPDYYNKTITPKFRANVEQVKQFFVEAKGFYDTARWDQAYKRCEQILNLDPYNIGARKMEEEIDLQRTQYAISGYDHTRAHQLWQLENVWQQPVRRFATDKGVGVIDNSRMEVGMTQRLQRKLETIIIPKLEFREATIREAIDFLKQKSVTLDTSETDPARRGVNIVLRLDSSGGGSALPAAAAPAAAAAPVIPGLEPVPGAGGAAPGGGASLPVGDPGDARITVSLTNIPLGEALRYVTGLANLKFKVEQYAVSVVPQATNIDTLVTKEWKVPPGFLAGAPSVSGGDSLAPPAPGGGGAASGDPTRGVSGGGLVKRIEAKDYLTASGVTFPQGSSAIFLPSSSKLIVKNTQENLDLIDAVVEAANTNGPVQVEIEAKFVEITQTNLKELSFDILSGPGNIPGNNSLFFSGGTAGTSPAVNSQDFPLTNGSGTAIGGAPITGSLRSGNLAISQNAIDALLFGVSGASALSPAVGALSGVFTDPQFQVVLRALNQKKGVDLLSAPRVTTKSGQRAQIEIIREFRYPTEFEPPQIPQTFGSTRSSALDTGIGGSDQSAGSFPVTPTTPTSFETRNTGVTLEVEPVVGPDGFTIDLNLVPQVVEFEGFINYGSPIQSTSTNALGVSVTNVITPNVINQPIFSTRKVQTSVSIFDGQTVVLGGLIREDVQKTEDKIPLLGDIPLIGRLFRSSVEQHVKRNLVVFVSARLINPAGEAVHNQDEVEEVVETLPLPEATSKLTELPLMPK